MDIVGELDDFVGEVDGVSVGISVGISVGVIVGYMVDGYMLLVDNHLEVNYF